MSPVASHLSAMQESSEERTEAYFLYGEGVLELLPQQRAKSFSKVVSFARKLTEAMRRYC